MIISTPDTNIPFRDEWETQAACRGLGPDLFFPTDPVTTERAYDRGKAFCRLCDVRDKCLAMALKAEETNPYRYGLFGGMTPKERERHVQKRSGR